jgi:hypothetical protein
VERAPELEVSSGPEQVIAEPDAPVVSVAVEEQPADIAPEQAPEDPIAEPIDVQAKELDSVPEQRSEETLALPTKKS